MKYRKKSVSTIEAFQLFYKPNVHLCYCMTQDEIRELPLWFHDAMNRDLGKQGRVFLHANGLYVILTSDGLREIPSGDYVIRGIEGQVCVLSADKFEATYERD